MFYMCLFNNHTLIKYTLQKLNLIRRYSFHNFTSNKFFFHIKQVKGSTNYELFMLREMQTQLFARIKQTTGFSEN